jgi:hypothetical protein
MSTNSNSIISITGDVVANRVYRLSAYYIRHRREWSKGAKIIFPRKMALIYHEDAFIGLVTIEKPLNHSNWIL